MDSSNTANSRFLWTLRYTLLNVSYFAAFCSLHALAAVFLLANGFTNTEIGILLAIANISSALCQPLIAGIIDRGGWLTNRRFILIAVLLIMAGSFALMPLQGNKPLVFVIYAFIYMLQFAYMPVMTALYFEYEKAGCSIFFGLARGLGSASFAVTSAFIGGFVEKNGVAILLIANVIAMLVSAVIIYTFKLPKGAVTPRSEDAPSESSKRGLSGFVKKYPVYAIFLAATVCFYFSHNMINDFMIQIIRSLGGGETELGYSNFLQAILELPVMAMIGIILKKISAKKLLVLSGFAFFVKNLILIFATNMAGMYLSQSCQLFAYAVFIPAAAYYVDSSMDSNDQVKGQALVTSAITVGGVFSNVVSGVVMDNFGIKAMLITGTAVCAVGAVVVLFALSSRREHT